MKRLSFDIECYINYFLLMFTDEGDNLIYADVLYNDHHQRYKDGAWVTIPSGESKRIDLRPPQEMGGVLSTIPPHLTLPKNVPLISFNGVKYDMPMLTAFCSGATNTQLKAVSDKLIKKRLMPWIFELTYKVTIPKVDHVDLIEYPAGMHSLKFYGVRLRARKLQELPYPPSSFIMPHMATELFKYCGVDNHLNNKLYLDQEGGVELRRKMSAKYNMDLMCKSEPQIGAAVVIQEAEKKMGYPITRVKIKDIPASFKYTPVDWIGFSTPECNEILNIACSAIFTIKPNGKCVQPREVNKQIQIGKRKYKFGIGGLHSVGDGGTYYSDDTHSVYQIDVRSYYPATIINGQFHPPQIPVWAFFGEGGAYQGLVDDRNNAKAILATLGALSSALSVEQLTQKEDCEEVVASNKLSLNGFYGKLGSPYAEKIYSPSTMVHVTLTGQLSLMMLIEQLELVGATMLSANTDGITVSVPKEIQSNVDNLVKWWEDRTGYDMDYDHYTQISYRDVNNYAVHYKNGKVNGIGIFCDEHIRHSPMNWVVRDSIFAYMTDGTHPITYILACDDVHMFIRLAKVSGVATKDGVEIGKVVRFYKSTVSRTPILPKKANKAGIFSKVPSSDNCVPLMDYPDTGILPDDLDRQWYIYEAYRQMVLTHMLTKESHHYGIQAGVVLFSELGAGWLQELIPFAEFCDAIGLYKKDFKKYKIEEK